MRAFVVVSTVAGAAALASLTIWFAAERRARIKLDAEHRALQQQLGEAASLIAENGRLSNLAARANSPPSLPQDQLRELLRLRGEVGPLRQQTKEVEAVRAENRQARQGAAATKAAATSDYWPRDSWAFAGHATPDAALQSLLWAANNGDLKALAASATGEVWKEMEQDFKDKSEEEASIRAMDHVASFKSIRVLNREVRSADTAVLTTTIEGGTQSHTVKLLLKKFGNDWKVYGPADP